MDCIFNPKCKYRVEKYVVKVYAKYTIDIDSVLGYGNG